MTMLDRRIQPKLSLVMALLTTITSLLATSCTDPNATTGGTGGANPTASTAPSTGGDSQGLKIGSLLSSTGDLASIAQPLPVAVKMAIDTVNSCGGINGAPVTIVAIRAKARRQ
jgi:neutral amino acid transport system substrate-binding protein